MKYAIIGSGDIGTALARAFARQNIEVAIANSRGPQTLTSVTQELGQSVRPRTVEDALTAEMIFLAVPFPAHKNVAKQCARWDGKIVVDVTNALHVPAQELGDRLSSELVAEAFVGARVVKAFNHLPAEKLVPSPPPEKRVVFVSSNDAGASAEVAAVAAQLGFSAVELGKLDEGGAALHVLHGIPGGLLFQNLVKVA